MNDDELRERVTAILWDEDHRVPGKGESAWARYQRLADALLNEDGPFVQDSLPSSPDFGKVRLPKLAQGPAMNTDDTRAARRLVNLWLDGLGFHIDEYEIERLHANRCGRHRPGAARGDLHIRADISRARVYQIRDGRR